MRDDVAKRVIDLAIQIQRIPAPTFEEGQRAEFVNGLFEREGLKNVEIDRVGNVYGLLKGKNQSKPLIISAHLDTVFPGETNLEVKREGEKIYGPGLGDNSLGVAALFGLMWMLRERSRSASGRGGFAGDVCFVANVCEEGLGDLRGMKAVVDRFGSRVAAYLVVEGMALGHIYHRAVGVKRYRVTARTQGGHSWSDFGQPSAVLELSKLIVKLASLKLPVIPRTTMNVGRIQGGTSINVIPSEAWMELDLRSEGREELAELVSWVDRLIEAANRREVRVEAEVIGERPAGEMPAGHPLIRLAEGCLLEQGLEPHLTSGSTDANVPMSKGYPALVLGVTRGSGAHTLNEFIHTAPVGQGLEQLARFVEKVWELL
jgi:acetylornithine deacetylase/succinyl-diaminopimelate desuccinylase-like protein